MNLRQKTILMILATFIVVMGAGAALANIFFLGSFRGLEQEMMKEEVSRFHYLLDSELENLATIANDWAAWDDTYRFIQSSDPAYIASNLVESTFRDLAIRDTLFLNAQDGIVFQASYDAQTGMYGDINVDTLRFLASQKESALQSITSGFFSENGQLMLFSANPILTSLEEGPSRGVLIFVKPYDRQIADHLGFSLASTATLKPYTSADGFGYKRLDGEPAISYDDRDPETIRFSSLLYDVNQKPVFEVEQAMPRTIYQRGQTSMRALLFSLALAGLIASGVSIFSLEKGILSRLSTLSGGIKDYEALYPDADDQLVLRGKDELATLSRTIHRALTGLSSAQSDLSHHLKLERLLVSATAKFINLPIEDIDQGIHEVLEVIGKYSNVDRTYILSLRVSQPFTMDETHEWHSPGTRSSKDEMQNVDVRQLPWWYQQMLAGKPVFTEDIHLLPEEAQPEKEILRRFSVKSIAIIPLIGSGKLIGFLGLDAVKEPARWTEQTATLLGVVGGIITNALDRRNHETKLLLNQDRQKSLMELTQESIQKSNLEATCRSISRQIKSLIDADFGLLVLKLNNHHLSAFLSGRKMNLSPEQQSTLTRLFQETEVGQKSFSRADIDDEGKKFPALGRSYAAFPLRTHSSTIGYMSLGFQNEHVFSKEELMLCQQAAPLVTLAIIKNRALESARRRSQELNALRDTIADITAELETEKLLQTILERAINFLNADGGDFCVFDENKNALWVVAAVNMDDKYLNTLVALGEGAAGIAAASRKAVIIDDYSCWNQKMARYENASLRAAMVTPLIIGDRLLGTVGMFRYSEDKKFSEEDQHLLALFAQHASIALDNAMLFEKIKELARVDPLTGLLNRRSFIERGEYEIQRARRLNRSLALAMVDLDNFKNINDRYGHQVGDLALREVSELLTSNIRNIDIIGRYGGDETVILMPETTVQQALSALERLRTIVEAHPFKKDESVFRMTASIGLTHYPQADISLEEMIAQADKAMYRAKNDGKNQVSL